MAANILSFVEDLNPAQDFWNMKARIIRVWEQQYRLDLILIDEQGSKIQATVKSHLISAFKSQLKEDEVVVINKFGVGLQEDKYKILPLQYKINFLKCTSVKPSVAFTGHPYGFSFIPMNNILQNRAIDVLTVDVIGKVVHCGDLELWQNGGRAVKRMNFDLEDLEGNVLRCTLWSRYAEDFNRYIVSNPSNEMVITIIQHAKIKIWKGLPTVQNDMYGTRVFINEDLDETNTLRKSLILRDGASSQSVLSSQTVYPSRVEFVQNTERKKVDEIREVMQEKNCYIGEGSRENSILS